MLTAQLKTALEEHANPIADWAQTPQELEWWCGLRVESFDPTVVLGWQSASDTQAFVLGDQLPLAYGELWLDAAENEVELARIIVAPHQRGQGVGQTMVRSLLEVAKTTGFPLAILRVVPENTRAIKCYEAVGFQRFEATQERLFNKGQPRAYSWYQYPLERGH
jgi:ribosomal protein S18 acetylase RimI-like enzyme